MTGSEGSLRVCLGGLLAPWAWRDGCVSATVNTEAVWGLERKVIPLLPTFPCVFAFKETKAQVFCVHEGARPPSLHVPLPCSTVTQRVPHPAPVPCGGQDPSEWGMEKVWPRREQRLPKDEENS